MKPAIAIRVVALAVVLATVAPAAHAAEIDALITTAMQTAIVELMPSFERTTGNTVHVGYGPSGGLARRFLAGEPADVIVVGSAVLDDLNNHGLLVDGRTDIAHTAIGICVRKGAPKPDVSTPEALKRALLAAKSVGYTAPAGGGVTAAPILHLFERLGIAAEIATKAKLAAGGPDGRVSVLVSSGQAEIGLQQVSELMSNPDVEVIGLLPADLRQVTVYSAAVTAHAREPSAARALIDFLAGPAATAIYKTKGLAL
jgi:molybdate transport system substrate-binding protein